VLAAFKEPVTVDAHSLEPGSASASRTSPTMAPTRRP
jgi:hypothetical protein